MSDVIVFAVRNAIHSDRVRDFCWLHSSRMSRKKGVACRHVIRNTTWIPLNVVDNQNSPNKDEREIGSIQLLGVDTNCLCRKLWTVQWTIIVTLLSKTDSVESELQLHLQQNTAKDYCSLLLKKSNLAIGRVTLHSLSTVDLMKRSGFLPANAMGAMETAEIADDPLFREVKQHP